MNKEIKGFERLKYLMELNGPVPEIDNVVRVCSRLLREEMEFLRTEIRQKCLIFTNVENEFHTGIFSAKDIELIFEEKN